MSDLSPDTVNDLVEFLRTHPEFERYNVPIAEPISAAPRVANFDEPFPIKVIEIINPFFSDEAWRKKFKETFK